MWGNHLDLQNFEGILALDSSSLLMANHKEAPSLLSLPAEIRVQIFKCLFVRSQGIKPQNIAEGIKYGLSYDDLDLHPAILRTSRKIYDEASQVLYEENVFRFTYFGGFLEHTNLHCNTIPLKAFQRIKNIRVDFHDSTWYPVTAECIASVLKSISRSGCSLKTLCLFIDAQGPRSLLDLYREDGAVGICELQSITPRSRQRRLELLDVLAELVVQQNVEINLSTVYEPSVNKFGGLLYEIAARIGWKVHLAKYSVEDVLTKNEKPCSQYNLTWLLQPHISPDRTQYLPQDSSSPAS